MTAELNHKIENIISVNQQADDREIVFQLKQLLHEIELKNYVGNEAKNIVDLVAESIYQLNEETHQNSFIKSGFNDFDELFGGLRLGEFVVVGGRPAMGKTQFLINVTLHISATVPVLFVTLDLSELLLTSRFIASVTEIPTNYILRHRLNEQQKTKLSTIGNVFEKRQLLIYDYCNISIAELKTICQKQIQEKGVKVIIVDYLQLMSSSKYPDNRANEMGYISRELKNIAKEYHVCVIASSQLNRGVENRFGLNNKRPQLSDLRESGAIEQDADKVLFINRPEYYGYIEDEVGDSLKCLAEIIVAKNRNGPLGEFQLVRDNDFTNFRNLKNDFKFSSSRLDELEEEIETPF